MWLIENLSATPTEMFALMTAAWSTGPTNWSSLAKVWAPTLLVCGNLEEDDGEGNAVKAAATLPAGRATVIAGIGHLQVFWRTDLTLPAIEAFLRAHWPSEQPDQ
jgi:pimeloyl-ACP methyl ester carboxylesterase